MKQYKVGDKVRISERKGLIEDYPFDFGESMSKLAGTICEIKKIRHVESFSNPKSKYINDDYHMYTIMPIDSSDHRDFIWAWHSSMFEPVESESKIHIGDYVQVGIYVGYISLTTSGKYYIFFDVVRSRNTIPHSDVCKTLHNRVCGFFELAKKYGATDHKDECCFPCFCTLNNLMNFVNELNECLNDSATSNSLKTGDPIWIGKMMGKLDCASSRYFVMFDSSSHCKTCTKLRELIPNFDSLAVAYGTISKSCPIDCFPAFPTLEKLLQFVAVINNKLDNSQKLQKDAYQFQRSKASIIGGSVPEGRKISGRKSKVAISSGYLSYRECHC